MFKMKVVEGIFSRTGKTGKISMNKAPVYVRATSDEKGESLSLQADSVMIMIPLEKVKEIITLTRN